MIRSIILGFFYLLMIPSVALIGFPWTFISGKVDRLYDMAMAVSAGAVPVGVAWGYHDSAELVRAGAVTVAETPADILPFARSRTDG